MTNKDDSTKNNQNGIYIPTNKLKMILISLGVIILCIGAGMYLFSKIGGNNTQTDAQILAVDPVYKQVKIPYQKCSQVPTTYKTKNQKNGETGTLIGSGIGGAAGGAAGAAIGSNNGGSGSAALGGALGGGGGAVAGGLIGRAIDKKSQPDYVTHTSTKQQCKTLYKVNQEIAGYKTQYSINNQINSLVTQNPLPVGSKIPLTQLLSLSINPDATSNNIADQDSTSQQQ